MTTSQYHQGLEVVVAEYAWFKDRAGESFVQYKIVTSNEDGTALSSMQPVLPGRRGSLAVNKLDVIAQHRFQDFEKLHETMKHEIKALVLPQNPGSQTDNFLIKSAEQLEQYLGLILESELSEDAQYSLFGFLSLSETTPRERSEQSWISWLCGRTASHGGVKSSGFGDQLSYRWQIAAVGSFYFFGSVFGTYFMGWTLWESLYFSTVTATTVGYGDYTPDTDGTKMMTVVLIIFAITIVGAILNSMAEHLIMEQQKRLNELSDDFLLSEGGKWQARQRFGWVLLQTLLVMLFGAAVLVLNEGWTWIDAVYFIVATGTTIGYGDEPPSQQSSLIFLTVYILLCVTMVSTVFGSYNELSLQTTARVRIKALLTRPLDVELLQEMDRDGDGVSDGEFIAAMLIAEGLVSRRDTDRYLNRFKELDVDRSGRLDAYDIELLKEEEAKQDKLRLGTGVWQHSNTGTVLGREAHVVLTNTSFL